MAVYLGNNKLTFDGISEIYVGSNKVYSAASPGPPIIDNPVNEYFCVYSAKSFTIRFEKIQTENGAPANLNYNNLKLKYSTNKTNWTEVSAAQGFNFNGGTLYYIYTSSADSGTTGSSSSLSIQSASWGQAFNFMYSSSSAYYSYTSTVMSFSGSSTIYLMGNIRTLAPGDSITTPYNTLVGSKTKIDCVSNSSSSSYGYCVRCCGLGTSSRVGSTTIRARGISNIQGTSNSIIDINNLFIGDYDTSTDKSSYPTFSYSTGTPYTPPYDPSEDYFYIENLTSSANTLSIKKNNTSAPTITVYRSTDQTTWTSMGSTSTTAITYSIPANSKVYLKATTNNWSASSSYYNTITCSSNYAVRGNTMSLLYGDSFIGKTVFPTSSTYNLRGLFYNSTYLKNIDNLVLPATTLTNNCYYSMFSGCTGLTSIPSNLLPATTLANYCYGYMFYGCTRLTSIPEDLLPATTLANYCYQYMFQNCTGLTSIPENLLHSTILATSCYGYMFRGCTGLTTIPSTLLPATHLMGSCYSYMFYGCTGLTSIPSNLLHSTSLSASCYSNMFNGCTGLTSIPSNLLPATTLASGCYYYMFRNCTSLTKAPELPATTLSTRCYSNMFYGCSSLNEITCYANDISATDCTTNWVIDVAASGTFYQGGSADWEIDSESGIPTGWTVKTPPKYFYIENLTSNANTLSIKKNNASAPTITVYYSTDKTTWTSIGDTDTTEITYSIPANSKVYLKATVNSWSTSSYYNSIACSSNYAVGGNIMSLLYGDNFTEQTSFPTSSTYNLNRLFYNSTYLKNIDNLVLPATTLTTSCYSYMFYGCTGLTSIPSNLLPATTLTEYCYSEMFRSCTGITSTPKLPATTLASSCYSSMFQDCSSLNEITCYANDISATNCTKDWVNGVAATGTFYKKGSASWVIDSVDGVPTGWTVIEQTDYWVEVYYDTTTPTPMKVYVDNTEVYDLGLNPPSASGYVNVGSFPSDSSIKVECYHITGSDVLCYWYPRFRTQEEGGSWSNYEFSTDRGTYVFTLSGNTKVEGQLEEDHKNSYFSVSTSGTLSYTCGARSNSGSSYFDAFHPSYRYIDGSWTSATTNNTYNKRVFWKFSGSGSNSGYSPATNYYGILCSFNGRSGISIPSGTTICLKGNILSGFWSDDFIGKTSIPTYSTDIANTLANYGMSNYLQSGYNSTIRLGNGSYVIFPLSTYPASVNAGISFENSTSSDTLEIDFTNVSSWASGSKLRIIPTNYSNSYKVIFYVPHNLTINYELLGTASPVAEIISTNR